MSRVNPEILHGEVDDRSGYYVTCCEAMPFGSYRTAWRARRVLSGHLDTEHGVTIASDRLVVHLLAECGDHLGLGCPGCGGSKLCKVVEP